MKRQNALYYATGGVIVLAVLIGVNFLFQAMQRTADVTYVPKSTVHALSVVDLEPGRAGSFKLGHVPVIVWRRDFDQQIDALEILGADIRENPKLLEEVKTSGEIEIEPGRVMPLEWFVVGSINRGGYGCIVLPRAGDFGGFLDPCQDVHFDLWGQVKSGPTETDLQLLPWSMSDDGEAIYIDIADAPAME